jgi:cupredoxin-like protein
MPLRIPTGALLAVALVAAGCGGHPVRESRSFTLVLDDFLIKPQSVEVPAGRLRLTVVNQGRTGHNLRIERGHHVVFSLLTLKPGVRVTRTLRLRSGRYTMLDSVPQHEILGQYGTLVAR